MRLLPPAPGRRDRCRRGNFLSPPGWVLQDKCRSAPAVPRTQKTSFHQTALPSSFHRYCYQTRLPPLGGFGSHNLNHLSLPLQRFIQGPFVAFLFSLCQPIGYLLSFFLELLPF